MVGNGAKDSLQSLMHILLVRPVKHVVYRSAIDTNNTDKDDRVALQGRIIMGG